MPTATNKADLLAVTHKEYEKLVRLIEPISEDQAIWLDPEDEISIKDTLAHRAHWIGLFLSWYEDGRDGLDVATPAPGYKWNQLKVYNAIVRENSRADSWQEILDRFTCKHEALVSLLESLDDKVLYSKHLYPWMNDWALGRGKWPIPLQVCSKIYPQTSEKTEGLAQRFFRWFKALSCSLRSQGL